MGLRGAQQPTRPCLAPGQEAILHAKQQQLVAAIASSTLDAGRILRSGFLCLQPVGASEPSARAAGPASRERRGRFCDPLFVWRGESRMQYTRGSGAHRTDRAAAGYWSHLKFTGLTHTFQVDPAV
jgi:hypothetical protein